MEIGAKLVVETLDGLAEGKLTEIPQNQKKNPKTAYKIFKEDTKIDWEKEVEVIHNFIRGMSPYPAAFTVLEVGGEQKILKIFKGKFQKIQHSKENGAIEISKNEFKIYAKNGVYFPEELQLEGKKRMNLKDFLNGFHSFDGLKLIK